jgi:uncharacterized protein
MGAYATREEEVDDLLRRKVFVDLYTVVRQGVRAGVPSYSLKDTEALAGVTRKATVKNGTYAVLAYETWMDRGEDKWLTEIAKYNEEDCTATRALRDWLVANRPPAFQTTLLPESAHEEKPSPHVALRERLIARPETAMYGELLEYHRREAKPAWWWFFQRCDQMSLDELVENDTESIGRIEPVGRPRSDKKSLLQTFKFPPQQYKLGVGDRPVDPATRKDAGLIVEMDEAHGTLVLRHGVKTPAPQALIPGKPIKTDEQRGALARLGESVLAGDGRYQALRDIVERKPPRVTPPRETVQTIDMAELRALAASLDGGALFVQGPPGTGKTYCGARMIVELMRRGRRVGVAATSHKAIHNLLEEVEEAAAEEGFTFRGVKKASTGEETFYRGTSIRNVTANADVLTGNPLLVAGTAWLFAHHDMDGALDCLVIDEAGQVSLADALAMGTSARNVILLGDPLQLAQVSQGTHPPGAGVSVLEHLLGEDATIPPSRGVFLEHTRRMHPSVCGFVSEIVYDKRLSWEPVMERQATAYGTGLRWVPVEHVGNQQASSEEASRVAAMIAAMRGGSWTDADGVVAPLGDSDFMVVAPYNAQVRRLRAALDAAGLRGVPAGTVDKFQGREAAVVFYSMATSSADDVPRSLEFLFSRNRLNVAVSRARCLAYVVASPRLLESRARTVDQMRLINALCRFVELAETSPRA